MWTGSSLTAYHDVPEVRCQIELARRVLDVGVPAFGSCWAAQIAAIAGGGRVDANPLGREAGVARKIRLSPEGVAHPLFAGKA
ncbi:MAG: GMP synthase, partial [Myxococcales bacterium]|nr:GMP synthase [Myxococcales bacterium]